MRIIVMAEVIPRNNEKAMEHRNGMGAVSNGIKIDQISNPMEATTIIISKPLRTVDDAAEHAHHPSLKMLAVKRKIKWY